MTARRRKTPERGPSHEVQGGQPEIHFDVRSVILLYNYKTSAFILCSQAKDEVAVASTKVACEAGKEA